MKIFFYERDNRKNDPDFQETCGSFSVIQNTLAKGLREIGCYTDNPNEADYVGIADSLALNFTWSGKKTFLVAFWDHINTLSLLHYNLYQQNKNIKVVTITQQNTELYQKFNIPSIALGNIVDTDYWYPTKPKNDIFTFGHFGFSNYRSGLDILLTAFDKAFRGNKNIKLLLKNTGSSEKLNSNIAELIRLGNNIEYIDKRMTFSEIRDLYSRCHINCNVLRHSGYGLPLLEGSLCNSLCLAGNFAPSNEMVNDTFAKLINPDGEVEVNSIINQLVYQSGLTNTFGSLPYMEEPKFYSYNLDHYVSVLADLYENWQSKYSKIDTSSYIKENYKPCFAAQKLVEYLKI
jgi:glycosyltransferase involved in cell wall biosynthesis